MEREQLIELVQDLLAKNAEGPAGGAAIYNILTEKLRSVENIPLEPWELLFSEAISLDICNRLRKINNQAANGVTKDGLNLLVRFGVMESWRVSRIMEDIGK